MTETGAQLFSRLEGRRCLRDIEPRLFPEDGGPETGEVVEIHGLEGTGKTELLYHVLVRCILPLEAGGLQLEVVFIDTDLNFDLLRLVSILEARLTGAVSSSEDDDDAAALRRCLSRLLMMSCSSSSQLLLSLVALDSAFSSRPGLSLLLIDSVSAFYWLDRCGGGESPANQEQTLRQCCEQLERLLRDYRFTVFVSCQAVLKNYRPSSSSSAPSSSSSPAPWPWDRQYLCRPWQRLVSHRLLCAKMAAARQDGAKMAAARQDGAKMAAAHQDGAKMAAARQDGAKMAAAHQDGAKMAAARQDGAKMAAAHQDGAKMAACAGGGAKMAAAAASSSTGGAANQQSRQAFTCHCTSNKTKASRHASFWVTDGGVVFS